MKFELGKIIAKRSLKAVDINGNEVEIQVLLGEPNKILDSIDIFAPYQIEYLDKKRLWYAVGIDGFQALHLAMKMIWVEIEVLERNCKIRLLFNRDKNGNLGFNNF